MSGSVSRRSTTFDNVSHHRTRIFFGKHLDPSGVISLGQT